MDIEEARAALEESAEFRSHKARRERIATAVLTGIVASDANPAPQATPAYRDHAGAASLAVKLADALIAALDAPVSS